MLNCRDATRLISDGLDRSLSPAERLRLGLHLLLCTPCHRFRRAARWLHDVLATPPAADVRLPDAARDRIRRALERAARDE
jgi:hypothetical protein